MASLGAPGTFTTEDIRKGDPIIEMSVPGVQTWLGTINPAYAKDDAKAKMILEEYEFTTELRTASVERLRAVGFKAGAAAAIVDEIHGDKVQEQAEPGGDAEIN